MRIVVYPHDLEIGGSQLNAIELAAGVRNLGHEVIVFGRRGALNSRIAELGLEFIDAPPQGKRPSVSTARCLRRLVRERNIDVIHGYEWPPVLDAALAMGAHGRAAVTATVMSMSVAPFIPRSVPLLVGTQQIAAGEVARGRRRVSVLEPPVDLVHNDVHGVVDTAAFRERFGLSNDRLNIVSVGRFARELKLEGTLTAIDTVGRLAESMPVRLVLVGDGPASDEVRARASEQNYLHGKGTIVLTGSLADPRPAYAAADISLGMGGSALRAMAYASPLVVQGEQGFWKTLTPQTAEAFLWTGWYGIDGGSEYGAEALAVELMPLIRSHVLRAELGAFGLELVRTRFSLTRAAALQLECYEATLAHRAKFVGASHATALARYSQYYARKRIRRARGVEADDDFNAAPAIARSKSVWT
ncbi:glycosyltransferase (plasmid) [Coraliomargarita sp. W4R53]